MLSLSECMAAWLNKLLQSYCDGQNKIIYFSSIISFWAQKVLTKKFDLYYAKNFKIFLHDGDQGMAEIVFISLLLEVGFSVTIFIGVGLQYIFGFISNQKNYYNFISVNINFLN